MDYVWVWGDQTGGNIMAPWQRCVWKPGEPFACRFLAQLIYTRRWRKQSTRRNSDLRSESLDGDSGEPHCERTWLSKNPWAEKREGERRSDRGIQEIAGWDRLLRGAGRGLLWAMNSRKPKQDISLIRVQVLFEMEDGSGVTLKEEK